jgi:hypothetical protein
MADRYLLESGSPDGYLLEDGSGVLLLESGSTGKAKIAYLGTSVSATSDVNRARVDYLMSEVSGPLENRAWIPYHGTEVSASSDVNRARIAYLGTEVSAGMDDLARIAYLATEVSGYEPDAPVFDPVNFVFETLETGMELYGKTPVRPFVLVVNAVNIRTATEEVIRIDSRTDEVASIIVTVGGPVYVGQQMKLVATFRNDGELFDPSVVKLTYRLPNIFGRLSSIPRVVVYGVDQVVRESIGVYYYLVTSEHQGVAEGFWSSNGVGEIAAKAFKVTVLPFPT